ncbi:DNA primase [Novosphingobium sp. LASN5T]|nr:DNA primase [Novosphingobium sp. LASN5T]
MWPLEARVWLYKAGFNNDDIQRHGFYFAGRIQRVVLPVLRDWRVIYWQARGFDADRPKYLNPPVDKPIAYFGDSGPLVLTEDILSAARVGAVARGAAILGTSLGDPAIAEVVREAGGQPVRIWLDPDSAGRKGTAKARKALSLAGLSVSNIRSELDPKFYTRSEIEEFILSV